MRRTIEIRQAFAPTRLSAAHLREVYNVVSPVVERTILRAEPVQAVERHAQHEKTRRRGGNR
jgi:hypothetical protein